MRILPLFAVFALIFGAPGSAFGQAEPPDDAPAASSMDGVWIEAVETYPALRKNSIDFGLGVYPFDPYYNAFAFTAGYTHSFSRSFAWEALSLSYLYTIDSSLREQLADEFEQNPDLIKRPKLTLSSHLIFMRIFGKFTSTDDRVRYFRAGPMLGGGIFQNSQESFPTANVGLRLEMHVSEGFAWKIDVRDHVAVTRGFGNYVFFTIAGGLNF
jgi:outer membrane beta-barrel protein